jgi:Fe-Mn family superoxide dismutase
MHTLPKLPYEYSALEPHIDAKTMEIHHSKHHQGYVDNLNKALEDHPNLQDKPLEKLLKDPNSLPDKSRTAIINHGGGHANHSLFWTVMTPDTTDKPSTDLAQAIDSTFGDFNSFQDRFTVHAKSQFGSGWAWLVLNQDKKLEIYSTPNQDSPYLHGHIPLLNLDVWEHAYYLKYQNRRPDYIEAWWNIVNWAEVEKRYLDNR